MATTTTFTGAGAVTVTVPAIAATLAMPAVDGSNLDLAITNSGDGPVWLSFAAGAPVGPTVPGCIVVPGGSQVLLTTVAATVAATVGNPLVLTGAQALAAQTATSVSATAAGLPTVVTITRGTAVARNVWRV